MKLLRSANVAPHGNDKPSSHGMPACAIAIMVYTPDHINSSSDCSSCDRQACHHQRSFRLPRARHDFLVFMRLPRMAILNGLRSRVKHSMPRSEGALPLRVLQLPANPPRLRRSRGKFGLASCFAYPVTSCKRDSASTGHWVVVFWN